MNKISIHDNFLVSYSVHCEKAQIRFQTEFRDQDEPFEVTEVVLYGVFAYHFEGDNLNTIIFDIKEYPVDDILKKYTSKFQQGTKYCWPETWNESMDKALNYLENRKAKAWEIESSYGMSGFIIGERIEFIRKPNT